MTYFRKRIAYYHWRGSVSPSCSGWEGVVPLCYGRQTKRGKKVLHGLGCIKANTVFRISISVCYSKL